MTSVDTAAPRRKRVTTSTSDVRVLALAAHLLQPHRVGTGVEVEARAQVRILSLIATATVRATDDAVEVAATVAAVDIRVGGMTGPVVTMADMTVVTTTTIVTMRDAIGGAAAAPEAAVLHAGAEISRTPSLGQVTATWTGAM